MLKELVPLKTALSVKGEFKEQLEEWYFEGVYRIHYYPFRPLSSTMLRLKPKLTWSYVARVRV